MRALARGGGGLCFITRPPPVAAFSYQEVVMIASVQPQSTSPSTQELHAKFVELLPSIRNQASVAFRGEPPELRQELIFMALNSPW